MKATYLFGPFIGETIYELNYFVGHAIFLRKLNPSNRIIVLTRKENFDLYGKYATILLNLPLSDELKPNGFGCKNMRVNFFDELISRFRNKYTLKYKINGHFYPKITTYLKDVKWYYPRDQVDFDFKPRPENYKVAKDIVGKKKKLLISDFHSAPKNILSYKLFPSRSLFTGIHLNEGTSSIGILIEMIRLAECVYADIDSISGRLAMLMAKPLITSHKFIDAQKLNPLNPYGSLVIGCQNLKDGINYLER